MARVSSGKNSKQDYATPWDFIRAVENRFGKVAFDLAASAHNTKAPAYFTKDDDSLKQDWSDIAVPPDENILWLNPEFVTIAPWVEKCDTTKLELADDVIITCLVPASVGSNWFRDHVHEKALVLFLNGRICFDGKDPYPKDCVLLVYGRHITPGFEVWDWKASLLPAQSSQQNDSTSQPQTHADPSDVA